MLTSNSLIAEVKNIPNNQLIDIAYIGTDTTENFSSLIRTVKSHIVERIGKIRVYFTDEWDRDILDAYPSLLEAAREISEEKFDLKFVEIPSKKCTDCGASDFSKHGNEWSCTDCGSMGYERPQPENINGVDFIISTYVTPWVIGSETEDQYVKMLETLMSKKTSRLISVDPKADDKSIRSWCSHFDLAHIYKKRLNLRSKKIQKPKNECVEAFVWCKRRGKMSEIIHSYLEDLRNCVMWGNCAGNTTRLDRLHQNRLIQRNLKVDTCISFFNLIAVIKESSREFVSYPENLQSVIDDLVSTLDGSSWFILCDELIPDSYEDTMEDGDYEKLDELAERIFNGDFSTTGEEFSDETTMSRIEHEMIRLSVETIHQIDLCYKEFWKQVKLFMEQGSFSTGEGRILGSVVAKIQQPFVVQWNGEGNDDVFGNNEQFWEKLRYGAVDLSEKIEQIWSHDVEPGTGQFGFAIYGNPGWGKTILLRQQAYQMANAIMDNNQDELIPVYVKAKVLAEQIELNSNGSFELGFVDHDDDDRIFSISHLENEIEICISSMLKSERELDEKVVRELITGSIPSEDTWGPILFLVDAYDEVPNEEGRINVLNFLHEQDRIHGNKSIITCRFTKKDELELFSDSISNIGGEGSINSLEIHFTEHECQFEMPTKLANAWGTESGKIEFYVSKYWREYENVLTTPLFVGLFCMLISHNEIQAEESSIKIRQVNRLKRRLVGEKDVTMPHVQFLTKVINFGLEKNIIDRVELTPNINLAKVKRVFLHVAATFKIFQLKSIDSILKYIERMHDIVLNDIELKIFRENLGVMFVNSENEIQWTHGTLPEVALGMLISEDSEFRTTFNRRMVQY